LLHAKSSSVIAKTGRKENKRSIVDNILDSAKENLGAPYKMQEQPKMAMTVWSEWSLHFHPRYLFGSDYLL
jgi:hypothetical protein